MQSVGTKDTGLELIVRRTLHRLSYRYFTARAYRVSLTSSFPDERKQSSSMSVFGTPTGADIDALLNRALITSYRNWSRTGTAMHRTSTNSRTSGGRSFWQCETKDPEFLGPKLRNFLESRDTLLSTPNYTSHKASEASSYQ